MKKKPSQLANTRFSAKARKPSRLSRFWLALFRTVLWLMLAAFLLFIAGTLIRQIKLELFDRNPHFTIHEFDIQVHGDTSEREIAAKLEELGVVRRETNLFEVRLNRLRRRLEEWSQLPSRQIFLNKQIPDTLEVTIFERDPVAQLHNRKGPFIDNQGVILPPHENHRRRNLPLITRFRKDIIPDYGEPADDQRLLAPLYLLELIERTPAYNQLLDINFIQVGFPSSEQMLLRLRQEGPFVSGAQIVMPLSKDELALALAQVEAIALDRLEARQMTGFIDASLEQNIPVLSYPRY